MSLLTNLLNCVLSPELLEHYQADLDSCTNGAKGGACTDPLAYEAACAQHRPRQLLHSHQLSLAMVNSLLTGTPDVRVVYFVGDGRDCRDLEQVASLLRQDSRPV